MKAIEDHSNGVESTEENQEEASEAKKAVYDPSDADHTYCVKVMLMAVPAAEELFQKTCHAADGGNEQEIYTWWGET